MSTAAVGHVTAEGFEVADGGRAIDSGTRASAEGETKALPGARRGVGRLDAGRGRLAGADVLDIALGQR